MVNVATTPALASVPTIVIPEPVATIVPAESPDSATSSSSEDSTAVPTTSSSDDASTTSDSATSSGDEADPESTKPTSTTEQTSAKWVQVKTPTVPDIAAILNVSPDVVAVPVIA